MDRVDRQHLTDTTFDVALRGYDKLQVEERLRFLGAELISAQSMLRAATERVAMLEDALSEAQSASTVEPAGDMHFGARVEKILKLAEDEAWDVRRQAEAAAMAMVDQAGAHAAELLQGAEREIAAWRTEADREAAEQDAALRRRRGELDNTRQEVERESERIRTALAKEVDQTRTAAGAEADELFRVATADAEHVRKAARAEAERLVAAATDAAQQRERSSAHELHQLSRLQEEINADLYRVKDLLDSLFGADGTVAGAIGHRRRKDGALPTRQARTV